MSDNTDIKQVTVISGKGGTGKTSLISSLAYLLQNYTILADADVDAADLYLIFSPEKSEKTDYYGTKKAVIDFDKCTKCMKCYESCRYGAIDQELNIEIVRCEGCGLCKHVCPVDAITMIERVSGNYFVSDTRIGKMIHARLVPGEESSGLLVAEVRKKALQVAKEKNKSLVLIDGSPGIGCPVISSLSGSHLAIVVSEPTISGKHDLERVLELLKQFNIPGFIVVNKSDINMEITQEIEDKFEKDFPVIAKIPHNHIFTQAMIEKKTVVEIDSEDKSVKDIQETIENIAKLILEKLKISNKNTF
ncbi:MAG: 4Fe-4S binding protein [Candidatus Heimdallarchaeaceae archaeon]